MSCTAEMHMICAQIVSIFRHTIIPKLKCCKKSISDGLVQVLINGFIDNPVDNLVKIVRSLCLQTTMIWLAFNNT